jgi:hypothetical protein
MPFWSCFRRTSSAPHRWRKLSRVVAEVRSNLTISEYLAVKRSGPAAFTVLVIGYEI